MHPENSELGKENSYDPHYNPNKLFPIARKPKREEIGVKGKLPFYGFDLWNHYEVSWLNEKGKPVVALAEIIYPCDSENIIESKSMKLYFNSFNNTNFKDVEVVKETIRKDISERIHADASVIVTELNQVKANTFHPHMEGISLDELDVICNEYQVNPDYLTTEKEQVSEVLYSDLLKSNCLVTNQPDWASVQIKYTGAKINHAGLLKYLISFRNHNEFHEQCIERIFVDILHYCKPERLIVYGRYTRRGGLDINPYRSTHEVDFTQIDNVRLCRQ